MSLNPIIYILSLFILKGDVTCNIGWYRERYVVTWQVIGNMDWYRGIGGDVYSQITQSYLRQQVPSILTEKIDGWIKNIKN